MRETRTRVTPEMVDILGASLAGRTIPGIPTVAVGVPGVPPGTGVAATRHHPPHQLPHHRHGGHPHGHGHHPHGHGHHHKHRA